MKLGRRLVVVVLAALLVGARVEGNSATAARTQTTIWCEKLGPAFPDRRLQERYDRAEAELCAGRYDAASDDFAAIRRAVVPDGTKLIDYQRRFIIASALGSHADRAYALLATLAPLEKSDPARDVFAKRYCAAMRGYLASDAKRVMTPDMRDAYHGPPPAFTTATAEECAGHTAAAIASLKSIASDNALYALALGNLYAETADWKNAGAAWWQAAGEYPEIPVPEWTDFDTFGPPALMMLWYYRAHLPKAPVRSV